MAKKITGDTRERLLVAASDVFAERGFRDATVAEICRRAVANISAVNYYFGSKETLYQEAWRHSFVQSTRVHPPDGGVCPDAPAAERLHGRIKALIERIADGSNRDFFISQMELVNPTGLLVEVMQSEFIPLHENTLTLVRELLGPNVPDQHILLCETCIISMCCNPMLIRRVGRVMDDPVGGAVLDDLPALADCVMKFALAGMTAVREASLVAGPGPQPDQRQLRIS